MIDDDLIRDQNRSTHRNPIFIIGIGVFFVYTLWQMESLVWQLVHFIGIRYYFSPLIISLLPNLLSIAYSILGVLLMIRWLPAHKQKDRILFRNLFIFCGIVLLVQRLTISLEGYLTTKNDLFNLAVLGEYQRQNLYISLIQESTGFVLVFLIFILIFIKGKSSIDKAFNPIYIFGYGVFSWYAIAGFWSFTRYTLRHIGMNANMEPITILWSLEIIKILFFPIGIFIALQAKSIIPQSRLFLTWALIAYIGSELSRFFIMPMVERSFSTYWEATKDYQHPFLTYYLGGVMVIILTGSIIYWVGGRYRSNSNS